VQAIEQVVGGGAKHREARLPTPSGTRVRASGVPPWAPRVVAHFHGICRRCAAICGQGWRLGYPVRDVAYPWRHRRTAAAVGRVASDVGSRWSAAGSRAQKRRRLRRGWRQASVTF